ncbi:MAG: DEAD/DEAH box helicase [bacterium]|nr:DEAD/DEAH box helicase [bacterium]
MSNITFPDLQLIDPILRALTEENYSIPTPIQAQSIPHLLEGGDLLGCAQTGTGKTAAFALPMLQRLHLTRQRYNRKHARSLILTPTRELALQIADNIKNYGRHLNLRYATIFGGVGQNPQVQALLPGVDILIATPGRLLDLIGQQHVKLEQVEILVLDEADRMLDMGFIRDVQKILVHLPKQRQTLFFSATMPNEVAGLANSMLSNPIKVEVNPVSSTAERIDDQVLFVESTKKSSLLLEILREHDIERALVFTRTKHRANRLAKELNEKRVRADAIHGNKSQNARQRALADFTDGRLRVLVATDIVARGIDVEGITHVINYDLPNEPESYVHRIGRTARAGTSGIAMSFCDHEESEYLADIEKLLQRRVNIYTEHSHHAEAIAENHAQYVQRRSGAISRRPSSPSRGGRGGHGAGRHGGGGRRR